MSHYDEEYDKLHEEEVRIKHEIKCEAQVAKRKLLELPYNLMIKIMFNGYLNTLSDKQVIELSKSIGGNINL